MYTQGYEDIHFKLRVDAPYYISQNHSMVTELRQQFKGLIPFMRLLRRTFTHQSYYETAECIQEVDFPAYLSAT